MSSQSIKILFMGDIFGEPGRDIIRDLLPALKQKHKLDLVLANCENAARGRGISKKLVKELLDSGVDFMTSGNHIFHVNDIYSYLNEPDTKVLRPFNYPKSTPGRGVGIIQSSSGVKVGVINIAGQLFMPGSCDLPFPAMDEAIERLRPDADILVLDMHAETTAEKRAMGWYVDGRVQLMVGTHTHVQTADEEILPKGTAYITDLGMCGPYDSVIGMDKRIVLKRMSQGLPEKFDIASGDVRLCGVVCEIDVHQKRAIKIERVCERL